MILTVDPDLAPSHAVQSGFVVEGPGKVRGAPSAMTDDGQAPHPPPVWAYGYRITPPLAQDRLQALRDLLEDARVSAKRDRRTWEGRFVVEEAVTHILVVSDTPDQQLGSNHRIEEELRRLEAGYLVTSPVALSDAAGEIED
jgi:hypothetical protein